MARHPFVRVLVLALLSGCGSQQRSAAVATTPPPAPTTEAVTAPAEPAPVAVEPAAPAPAPAAPVTEPGDAEPAISRHALAEVLEAGPALFLRRLDVRPSFTGRSFRGWELVSGDPTLVGRSLAPGDIVLAVNGKPIERPEQFQDVWESLRFAEELSVELVRQGARQTLRYKITP